MFRRSQFGTQISVRMMAALIAISALGLARPVRADDGALWPFPWITPSQTTQFVSHHKLPALSVDPATVSVSGLSAGAYMAIQLHMAYSTLIMGVGSVAGGPWNCSQNSLFVARDACMADPSKIHVPHLLSQLRHEESVHHIDELSNVARARVYLYNSPADDVIHEPMNSKLVEFYSALVPAKQIHSEQSVASAHGFPTDSYGLACNHQGSPYLINCAFDTAGEILKFIYAETKSVSLAKKPAVRSSLQTFDQTEFAPDVAELADAGWIYIPEKCEKPNAKCALHVALHGCLQTPEHVKSTFVNHAGYNEWAEGSGVIVLYPQAKTTWVNPNGCFDWWGYGSPDYTNQKGPQMRAIKAMIDRVLGS